MKFCYIFILLFTCISNKSDAQSFTKITGIIYTDTLLTETISGVKITLLDDVGNRIGSTKTSKSGTFTFKVNTNTPVKTIIIGGKKYQQLHISPVFVNDEKKDVCFKAVLKKVGSIHDADYSGKSKLIAIE